MLSFGNASAERLSTCADPLQRLFAEVIRHQDCTVIEGHRSNERQEELFRAGKSKLHGGQSKHNSTPSRAVDVAPYPIDWNDRERFLLFVGRVRGIADSMGINIRCGADWDGDGLTSDQTFHDLPHFELVD